MTGLTPLPSPTSHADGEHPPDERAELASATSRRLRAARDCDPVTRQVLLDEVVVSHLWVADTVAWRFRGRGEDPDDLRQIACSGLVEACLRFDPDRGPFLPFARSTVVGLVKRHFRDHAWSVRPPRPTQELSAELWRRWPDVAQTVGGVPSDAQLAVVLDCSVVQVRTAFRATAAYRCSELDPLVVELGADGGATESARSEARLLVAAVWWELLPAERELLRLRFVDELSQEAIAVVIDGTQLQVSRALTRLMTKLRGLIGPVELDAA